MSAASLDSEQSWLKRQPTVEGKNYDVVKDRYRSYTGTLREALGVVLSTHRAVEAHKWEDYYSRRQYHLDAEHFDGETEAMLTMDFSSALIMGAGFRVVCESDATYVFYIQFCCIFFNTVAIVFDIPADAIYMSFCYCIKYAAKRSAITYAFGRPQLRGT
jgi:hypothetical protein